jgi:ArsR family transcriptional regulator, arsenate/arsenite/antimonite-responsive transcriptional repressor
MDLIQIYECFCDQTRLRILHLLAQTPLCVCHFQEILCEPQVKISKHLAYLREREMVVAERQQNWMIYSLPSKRASELEANLKCLQDCVQSDSIFKRDLKALSKLRSTCCEPDGILATLERQRRRAPLRLGAAGNNLQGARPRRERKR